MRRKPLFWVVVWMSVILASVSVYVNASAGLPGGVVTTERPKAPTIGGTDANVVLPDGTFPKVTQSESMVWGNGSTIVTAFNDSRAAGSCNGQVSTSTDGGATWTTHNTMCTGHGGVLGDPIVVYNAHLSTWFVGFIALGCGGQGLGLWTSPDGQTWSTGACSHTGSGDDRESMWVDNDPSSPHYGRMYISWNNLSAGRLQVNFSDDGTVWSAPVSVVVGGPFIRNGQITGSANGDGYVFSSGHTEGSTDTTYIFRSTDGGTTWTQLTVNSYSPAGATGLPGCTFRAITPIWRVPEWGQPVVSGQVAGQNVVSYVYAAQGTGGDLGDAYYIRSTDNGATWLAPFKLNTDSTTQPQWQPSISADTNGGLVAGWYDRRNTTNGTNYEYFGRISTDNGATWGADEAVSDVLITQPAQPDGAFSACYAGDYNYHSAFGNTHFMTWTDGRNAISGTNQQDVYFDKVVVGGGGGTPTSTPTRTPTVPATNTVPTATPTRTNTASNTPTNTATRTATNTATPTNTATSTRTPTTPPASTSTRTPTTPPTTTPTTPPTASPTNTLTASPTRTPTNLISNTPTSTLVATDTSTPTNTATDTPLPTETATSTNTPTATETAASVSTSTSTPTATPTVCVIPFTDVNTSDWFYDYVAWMYCHGVINGYSTNPPCDTGVPCFKPGNNTTRGQTAKIVVLAFGFPINTSGGPHFSDVATNSTFYDWIETGYNMGLLNGYDDGTYRPSNNVSRGQIAKIVVNAAIIADPPNWTLLDPATNTFEDVAVGSTFFRHIETAAAHNVINGYPCGTPPAGACVRPGNKPYFVPGDNATRAQISKIVYLAVTFAPPGR